MKKSNLRDFTCPIKHTFSQEKKNFISLIINPVARVPFDSPVSRLDLKMSVRPGANKNEKTKNQTVYHETYLISIPRPATSVATRMSLAPALRLDKANSLKENQQKESL